MDLTEFLNEFQLEAGEKLDSIASQLLRLERDTTDPQPIREMFLAAHTVKGGAAMLHLTQVEALAHALEDSLSSFRDRQRTLDATAADLLFQAIDRLRALINQATRQSVGAEPDPDLLAFVNRLQDGGEQRPAIAEEAPPVRRALVVDASATVRELQRMVLEDAGYEVNVCDDGQLALSRATTEVYGLVIAGLQNDTLSGFELCSALRQHASTSGTRVILTSADASSRLARKASEAGAVALVRKGTLRDGALTNVIRELG